MQHNGLGGQHDHHLLHSSQELCGSHGKSHFPPSLSSTRLHFLFTLPKKVLPCPPSTVPPSPHGCLLLSVSDAPVSITSHVFLQNPQVCLEMLVLKCNPPPKKKRFPRFDHLANETEGKYGEKCEIWIS